MGKPLNGIDIFQLYVPWQVDIKVVMARTVLARQVNDPEISIFMSEFIGNNLKSGIAGICTEIP